MDQLENTGSTGIHNKWHHRDEITKYSADISYQTITWTPDDGLGLFGRNVVSIIAIIIKIRTMVRHNWSIQTVIAKIK